jgi:hypothetical protein
MNDEILAASNFEKIYFENIEISTVYLKYFQYKGIVTD